MLRAVHLLVLLWGMDTARGDVTQDAKEEVWGSFVFCKCGLTCETQLDAFFGQSCACHECNGTNSTGLLRGAERNWSPSRTPQILECRCGRYCSYGRQLGGGRGDRSWSMPLNSVHPRGSRSTTSRSCFGIST
eukprot:g23195.t1